MTDLFKLDWLECDSCGIVQVSTPAGVDPQYQLGPTLEFRPKSEFS